MSHTKHEMEMDDDRHAVATDILIRAGVLGRCEVHGIVFDRLGVVEDAYRLGNALYTAYEKDLKLTEEARSRANDAMEVFESRRQMTDTFQEVYNEPYGTECAMCAKD